MPDCEQQNTQTLNTDFSYRLTNACNAADSQTGTWMYVDTKRIVINGLRCDIASFDGKNLVFTFTDFLGRPGVLTETLTKK